MQVCLLIHETDVHVYKHGDQQKMFGFYYTSSFHVCKRSSVHLRLLLGTLAVAKTTYLDCFCPSFLNATAVFFVTLRSIYAIEPNCRCISGAPKNTNHLYHCSRSNTRVFFRSTISVVNPAVWLRTRWSCSIQTRLAPGT